MTESILQDYLNEQHIKTNVKEDIEGLRKAVKEVKKHLNRRKVKVEFIPFTLVALDPKVKDTDVVVQQVESIIIKNWPTFKNSVVATKDKSTTYVRAVILESLRQLAEDDVSTTALIWLTARDVISYYQLDSEESVISEFLQGLANRTEENGRAAWGTSSILEANEYKGVEIPISLPKPSSVSQNNLKNTLLKAAQHTGWSRFSNNIGDNPNAPNNQNWANFFAENAAEGISEEINSALSDQSKSLSSITKSIQKSLDTYFDQLQPIFEDTNTFIANSINANNKRSELIWWKQSLYSRLLNNSYRNLDQLNAAVSMALDLAEQVGSVYPESVEYILRETLKDVHGDQVEEEKQLIDWLSETSNLHEDIQLKLNIYIVEGDMRKHLFTAFVETANSGITTDFFDDTGIGKKAKLSLSDLAIWLFHGIQVQKLATGK